MTMTAALKIEVLKAARDHIRANDTCLCLTIAYFHKLENGHIWPTGVLRVYGLKKYKPKSRDLYSHYLWFPMDEGGKQARIAILNARIKELENERGWFKRFLDLFN